jgi:hypothetical protein
MNIATLTNRTRRELAQRTNGGLEITLYWHPDTNRTSIDVHDNGLDETISFPVPAGRALDAFHHPFVYLPTQPEPTDHFVPSRN